MKSFQNQKVFELQGIKFLMPFEPYNCQLKLIESIFKALNESTNGLFHSPTGTGKTLCFLISVLSWKLKHETKDQRQIKFFYCTRTHSQIDGIIKELRKTAYHPKITILASREKLCINKNLEKFDLNMKTVICNKMAENSKKKFNNEIEILENEYNCCPYYLREYPSYNTIMDLEELHTLGSNEEFCPYFFGKKNIEKSDVIILSYNYLIDSKLRKNLKDYLENSIILFDEAHNIDEICEKTNSSKIKLNNFNKIKKLFQITFDNLTLETIKNKENIAVILQTFLTDIKNFISFFENCTPLTPFVNRQLFGKQISDFFETYFKNSIFCLSYDLEKEITLVLSFQKKNLCKSPQDENKENKKNSKKIKVLRKFINFLWKLKKLIRNSDNPEIIQHFVVYITVKYSKPNDTKKITNNDRVINIFCFDPSMIFKSLEKEKIKSIFFASGTLTPLEFYESRLGINFGVKLMNDHVIDSFENLRVGIISKGSINDLPYNFNYFNRQNNKLFQNLMLNLGDSILQLCHIIPNGVLVFFPSYTLLNHAINCWCNNDRLYVKINSCKKIFIEKKIKDLTIYKDYCNEAKTQKGAILFTIMRGKLSEGIDFIDKAARAVLIVGIPFSPIHELSIELKKIYLNRISTLNKIKYPLNGDNWYVINAIKTVNQAIGRVIRHKNDYGVILFFDQRYFRNNIIENISQWAQDKIFKFNKTENSIVEFKEFFKKKKNDEDILEFERNNSKEFQFNCKIEEENFYYNFLEDENINQIIQEDSSNLFSEKIDELGIEFKEFFKFNETEKYIAEFNEFFKKKKNNEDILDLERNNSKEFHSKCKIEEENFFYNFLKDENINQIIQEGSSNLFSEKIDELGIEFTDF